MSPLWFWVDLSSETYRFPCFFHRCFVNCSTLSTLVVICSDCGSWWHSSHFCEGLRHSSLVASKIAFPDCLSAYGAWGVRQSLIFAGWHQWSCSCLAQSLPQLAISLYSNRLTDWASLWGGQSIHDPDLATLSHPQSCHSSASSSSSESSASINLSYSVIPSSLQEVTCFYFCLL